MSNYKEWLYNQTDPDSPWYPLRDYTMTLSWDGTQKGLYGCSAPEWYEIIGDSINAYRGSKKRYERVRTKNGYVLEYDDFRMNFRTKQDMRAYYKVLKDQIGERGGEMTEMEQKATKALFTHHHDYMVNDDENFYVAKNLSDQWSWFVNGQAISYIKCTNYVGKGGEEKLRNNKIRNMIKACRNDIDPQIKMVEKSHPDDQIDHDVIPFNALVRDWLLEHGYKISEVTLSDDYPYYLCGKYHDTWVEYHRRHAILRPLSALENSRLQPPKINWLNFY